ncbi:MAG: hypothetical protein HC786_12730 [Richelia sp. CSU_2_1]|nr:hypothetical protein [Microcoleus sp. SM1_3_4]NJR22955.1 hypothetical protein [Richelia sp. CSU_2_1]
MINITIQLSFAIEDARTINCQLSTINRSRARTLGLSTIDSQLATADKGR